MKQIQILTAVFCVINFIQIGWMSEKKPVEHKTRVVKYVTLPAEKFSPEKFYEFLILADIKFPKIVYAQAILESGTFTSNKFKKMNNMFGMMHPHSRPTTAIGKINGFAKYNDWKDAVLDYRIYQRLYLAADTPNEYYQALLGAGYFSDESYIKKLKDVVKDLPYD